MDPVTLGAIATAAGAIGAGGIGFLGQRKANRANLASAREQMAFQERMSNTGYQRAVQDARLANLNPIAIGKVGPASTPGGASSSSQNELSEAANSASSLAMKKAVIEKARAEASITKKQDEWQRDFAQWDLAIKAGQSALIGEQLKAIGWSARESEARTAAINAMLPGQKADAKFKSGIGGDIARWVGLAGQGVSTALDFKSLLTPSIGPNFSSSKYFLGSKSTGEIFNP